MKNEPMSEPHTPKDPSWFERNVNTITVGLIIACVATVLAQVVLPLAKMPMFDDHHPPHFPSYENMIGFQALFGFAAFVCVVFIGKFLRLIIRREEDYYDA